MISNSRQMILDRIRAATRSETNRYDEISRGYIRAGTLDSNGRIHLMTERLHEYGADVVECAPAEIRQAILRQIQLSGKHKIVIPPGLSADWLGEGVNWLPDKDLTHDQIEACEGVLTASSAGIADSGTIVLHHGTEEGRRVISLLPDFHLCILYASQIVETLPEYFSRFPDPPRLATYISGPSATADIEMTRIKGVHGPRFLSVIIVRDDS
ncbi:MAG: LUD domain-containing protein [Acidobacteria bacterium]|nr:LUD domain-containing protein [Acidobacteriota bacterium]